MERLKQSEKRPFKMTTLDKKGTEETIYIDKEKAKSKQPKKHHSFRHRIEKKDKGNTKKH